MIFEQIPSFTEVWYTISSHLILHWVLRFDCCSVIRRSWSVSIQHINFRRFKMVKIEYSAERHKLPCVSYTLPESVQIGRLKLMLGETIDYKFKRACVAEFIAMTFFVVICCGCAMVTLNLPNPNLFMIAASFGECTMNVGRHSISSVCCCSWGVSTMEGVFCDSFFEQHEMSDIYCA